MERYVCRPKAWHQISLIQIESGQTGAVRFLFGIVGLGWCFLFLWNPGWWALIGAGNPYLADHFSDGDRKTFNPLPGRAGDPAAVEIQGELIPDEVVPNEEVRLVLTLHEPADLYYMELEIDYDPDRLDFVDVNTTGITGDGLKMGGLISAGRVGVSVSRTDGEENIRTGPFLEVIFRASSTAALGVGEIDYHNMNLINSAGDSIEVTLPDPIEFEVLEGLGAVELLLPADTLISEGELLDVKGRVFASGITEDQGEEERLDTWVGMSDDPGDPELWEEESWTPMEFAAEEDAWYHFQGQAGSMLGAGTWYVAMRSRLDEGGYLYGGLGGNWSASEHPSAILEVEPPPAFRHEIVRWDFSHERLTPDRSLPANDTTALELVGAQFSGDPIDLHTHAGIHYLNTRSWHHEADIDDKYLVIEVNTHGLTDLKLSSSHRGSNTAPARFDIEMSKDGSNWSLLPGGEVDMRDREPWHAESLQVPQEFEESGQFLIRWRRVGDARVDGSEGIGSSGVHRIGNIRLTGQNPDPVRVEVFPGDALNSGEVNTQDLLAIAEHWQRYGPTPFYNTLNFVPREVEQWIPDGATFADTNGDGVVDHRDLMPIGMNFGMNHPGKEPPARQEPVATLELPALANGEEVELKIRSALPIEAAGISFRLRLEGIHHSKWEVSRFKRPEWIDVPEDSDRLLEMQIRHENLFETAHTVAGRIELFEIQDMIVIRLRAVEEWSLPPKAELEWVAIRGDGGTIVELEEVYLALTGEEEDGDDQDPDDKELATHLEQNYPNPFHSDTVIEFHNSHPQPVLLEIYDLSGRSVKTLVDGWLDQGQHSIRFVPGALASGIYLYRLVTEESTSTRKMVFLR